MTATGQAVRRMTTTVIAAGIAVTRIDRAVGVNESDFSQHGLGLLLKS
jgi:hypothetical protein